MPPRSRRAVPRLGAVEPFERLGVDREALLACRESATPYFLGVALEAVADRAARFGVALDERRREAAEEADGGVEDEHLAVAMRAGADADGRDADALRDEPRELRGHELEHDAPAPGALEGHRALDDAPHAFLVLALALVAAERGRGLRREADVAEHRDAGIHQRFHDGHHLHAALELHRIGARVLHETRGRVP